MPSTESIREALPIVGLTILEITCTDHQEVVDKSPDAEDCRSRIYLHLSDGSTASFVIGQGALAFSYDGFSENHPFRQAGAEGAL